MVMEKQKGREQVEAEWGVAQGRQVGAGAEGGRQRKEARCGSSQVAKAAPQWGSWRARHVGTTKPEATRGPWPAETQRVGVSGVEGVGAVEPSMERLDAQEEPCGKGSAVVFLGQARLCV